MIIASVFLFFCLYGTFKKVDILSAFTKGVLQGIMTLKSIFPTLLFVLSVIFVIRNSGVMDFLGKTMSPLSDILNIPSEIFPMVLLRPLSGSGSLALLQDIFANCGVNSYTGFLASVISASTETTLYTVSVYLGGLSEKCGKIIFAALLLDLITFLTASVISPLFF